MSESDENLGTDRGEAVIAIFQRGAEFTKQILDENTRLRRELSGVELRHGHAARSDQDWEKLRHELLSKIEELENANESILEQLRSVEGENLQFAERYVEVEEENNNLANLYVASYQLHSTLDPSEVLKVDPRDRDQPDRRRDLRRLREREGDEELRPVAAEGEAVSCFPMHRVGQGCRSGRCVADRRRRAR